MTVIGVLDRQPRPLPRPGTPAPTRLLNLHLPRPRIHLRLLNLRRNCYLQRCLDQTLSLGSGGQGQLRHRHPKPTRQLLPYVPTKTVVKVMTIPALAHPPITFYISDLPLLLYERKTPDATPCTKKSNTKSLSAHPLLLFLLLLWLVFLSVLLLLGQHLLEMTGSLRTPRC